MPWPDQVTGIMCVPMYGWPSNISTMGTSLQNLLFILHTQSRISLPTPLRYVWRVGAKLVWKIIPENYMYGLTSQSSTLYLFYIYIEFASTQSPFCQTLSNAATCQIRQGYCVHPEIPRQAESGQLLYLCNKYPYFWSYKLPLVYYLCTLILT